MPRRSRSRRFFRHWSFRCRKCLPRSIRIARGYALFCHTGSETDVALRRAFWSFPTAVDPHTGHRTAHPKLLPAIRFMLPPRRVFHQATRHARRGMTLSTSNRTQIGTLVMATSVVQLANGFFGTYFSLLTSQQVRRHSYCTVPKPVLRSGHETRWTRF